MNPRTVVASLEVVAATLDELTAHHGAPTERVALWLGIRHESQVLVREVYVPEYAADTDYFHIGPAAMGKLIKHLRKHRLLIAAQLHTHPAEAFHSAADDRWAIVRHVGALSIVLPDFGQHVVKDNFLVFAKVFTLTASNEWTEVKPSELFLHLKIHP